MFSDKHQRQAHARAPFASLCDVDQVPVEPCGGTADNQAWPGWRSTSRQSFPLVRLAEADDGRLVIVIARIVGRGPLLLLLLHVGSMLTLFLSSVPSDTAVLLAEARWHGAVLVAYGAELIVVERWRSTLPSETLATIKSCAGAMIAALRGESRRRCARLECGASDDKPCN